MRRSFYSPIWILALLGSATVETTEIQQKHPSSVVLRYPGSVALGADDADRLRAKAIRILESSNFNSTAPPWEWNESKTNLEYGEAVSGKHLLVTFVSPRVISTIGGKVVVREIVIGLNGPHHASSLHTIDDEGHIVGHAKYSGPLCVELLEMVKTLGHR